VMETETRKLLWATGISGDNITVMVSAHAEMIAISSEKDNNTDTQGKETERKMQIFDRLGNPLFPEKGGRFLSPEVVTLSPDGTRLTLYDATRHSLFTLNEKGKMVGLFPLPDLPVKKIFPTPNGKYLLIVFGDNKQESVGFYERTG
jgi:hypothetical protein